MEEEIHLKSDTKVFGFWVYLMTDLVIFAALFASYLVLHNNTFTGPSAQDLFDLPFALTETLVLLVSNFSCALGMLSVHKKQKKWATLWFFFAVAFGIAFLFLEITEFHDFIKEGASPQKSAFLSSFFTLVGTHGTHVFCGLLWMVVEIFRIWLRPLSFENTSKTFRMALFWHFLDFVWIFIFTTVYGMGHLL